MAEWVQKGNLKGPQGDPGQDAQLPAGGTEGQVLTKTADGEAWQDAPEADLTGMLKGRTFDGGEVIYKIGDGGEETPVSSIAFASNPDDIANGAVAIIGSTQNVALFSVANGSNALSLHATSQFATLTFNSKSVNSITNAISSTDTDRANELVTGKAVADYVDAHVPEVSQATDAVYGTVKFASDADFRAYMGMN